MGLLSQERLAYISKGLCILAFNITRVGSVVGVHESLVISIYGASHPRPGMSDAQIARHIRTVQLIPLSGGGTN